MPDFYIVVNGSEIHFEADNIDEAIMMAADTCIAPPLHVFASSDKPPPKQSLTVEDERRAEALEALNKLEQRCLKTAHSPGGEEAISEWAQTVRSALSNPPPVPEGFCIVPKAWIEEIGKLANLMEEAGEVIQMAAKWQRFGRNNYHPDDPEKTTNERLLCKELGNLHAMQEQLGLEYDRVDVAAKHHRVKTYGLILTPTTPTEAGDDNQ